MPALWERIQVATQPRRCQSIRSFQYQPACSQPFGHSFRRARRCQPVIADWLDKMGPFGIGNTEPRFVFTDCHILKSDIVGSDNVKCLISDSKRTRIVQAIYFKCLKKKSGHVLLKSQNRNRLNILGYIRRNSWLGPENVQLIIDDLSFKT